MQALYAYKAGKDIKELSEIKNTKDLEKDIAVSVSIGSSKQTTRETVHVETVNPSNIHAGGKVTVIATEGDATLTGVKLKAQEVAIKAARDIELRAAQNKQQIDSKTKSSSWAVGGSSKGYFANVSSGKGKENETSTTHEGSSIAAKDRLTLISGNDLNIIGSKVAGETVVTKVGHDLNIVSLQDTEEYKAKNKNSGIGFSLEKTGPKDDEKIKSGVTGSVGKGKTDSTYQSVTDQAGIYVGEGGFDIEVGGNTDLKGAVIASEATADKNKLSTDTLTYSDIQNKADYSASSTGVNYSSNGGFNPTPGMPVSGDADSTTRSAVSLGTIEVRSGNADLSNLNRNADDALNTLGKIFDKKTVQEKQEFANLFVQEANELVGKIASQHQKEALDKGEKISQYMSDAQEAYNNGDEEKAKAYLVLAQTELDDAKEILSQWGPGGTMKILLHTVVGGITADLSGSNVLAGAVSDGTREASRKILTNLSPKERQWAAVVIGAAVGKITGGKNSDVQTGIGTAVPGAKKNHDIDDIFNNNDYLAWAVFGRENESSKDRLWTDAVNKKMMPAYLSWCQQSSDLLGAAGIPFKFAFEVQKQLYEHYDDPSYGLKQATYEATKVIGIEYSEDKVSEALADKLAQKYNLSDTMKDFLKRATNKAIEISKEKALGEN